MTPQSFQGILRAFPHLEGVSGEMLKAALDAAPYSQVLQNVYARYCQDHQLPNAASSLKSAAVRSTDRTLLRDLITGGSVRTTVVPEPARTVPLPTNTTAAPEPIRTAEIVIAPSSQPVIPTITAALPAPVVGQRVTPEQLYADIEALKAAMVRFEETVQVIESRPPAPVSAFRSGAVSPAPEVANEVLLTEIKSTRKRIKPETSRQAEQLEIIDLFIKSKSAVVRPPEGPVVRQDLTESLDQYSENVISETLVDILIGQGKTTKAIEVLRKLIWKYPQKKHLFAARIQELSK